MRRIAGFTALILLVLGSLVFAAPMITVDQDIYQFGEVLEGVFVTHTFVLSNTGDEPLMITRVTTSCGCTTTSLSQTSIAAGKSVDLATTLDTQGYGGRTITKLIKIESNDPQNKTLILQLKGTVKKAQPYHIAISDLNYLFYLMIDLRDPTAYTAGHLMGAINIPYATLSEWRDRLPQEVLIILYDQDGSLSDKAAQTLNAIGFHQARSLLGGLNEWERIYHQRFILPQGKP